VVRIDEIHQQPISLKQDKGVGWGRESRAVGGEFFFIWGLKGLRGVFSFKKNNNKKI
jgi:hypothetical protein